MDDDPKDPRVVAMLAALFGEGWRDRLKGDVAFESGPMDTWIYAVERMLGAADAVDPLRVALRGVVQTEESSDEPGSSLPALR